MNKKLKALLDVIAANKESQMVPFKSRLKEMLFGFIVFKQSGRKHDDDFPTIGAIMYDIPTDIAVNIWKENSEVDCLRALGVSDTEIYTRLVYLVGKHNQDFPQSQQATFNKLDDEYNELRKQHKEMNNRIEEKQKEIKKKLEDLNDYLEEI